MPNTFMAVILDTANPSGGVHSPYKQPAAARLEGGTRRRVRDQRGHAATEGQVGCPRPWDRRHRGTDLGTTIEVRDATGFEKEKKEKV